MAPPFSLKDNIILFARGLNQISESEHPLLSVLTTTTFPIKKEHEQAKEKSSYKRS